MNDALLKTIDRWIDDHTEEYIAEVQSICRIPSVSRADLACENAPFGPDCRKVLDHALDRARAFGLKAVDHDGYAGSAYWGEEQNSIAIMGHIDVVPEGDGWIYPPYGATRVGNYLIGRGVSDDKGPAMGGLFVVRMMKELGIPLRHSLSVFFGCSEETGMQDIQYYINHAPRPAIALVPDSSFPVCIAQKGTLGADVFIAPGESVSDFHAGLASNIVPAEAAARLTVSVEAVRATLEKSEYGDADFTIEPDGEGCVVTAHGILAHAAAPDSGKNAIRMLVRLLSECDALSDASLSAVRAIARLIDGCFGESCGLEQKDDISGSTTTNFGVARLENGLIRLHLDARLCVAADPEAGAASFAKAAEALGFSVAVTRKSPSFRLADDSPVVNALMDAYRSLGYDRAPYAMGGGTYSRWLPETIVTFGAGLPGEPCPDIPATHGGAHKSDEFLNIANAVQAMKIYARAILRLDEILQ